MVENIKSSCLKQKPVIIALDGFGGSGKTTLAKKLSDALGDCYVIAMDDFIVKEKITEPSWDKGSFDRRRLEQQVLMPAKSGNPVRYQKLIWQSNSLSEPVAVPNVSYLVVEGISTLHPDISKYFDYKIWVDAPIEVSKQRGQARDKGNENEQHWELWAKNDLDYQSRYHPERVADFVYNNG